MSDSARFIQPVGDVWMRVCGVWAVSPYPKCSFRCVYCNAEAQGDSIPDPRFKARVERGLADLEEGAIVGIGVSSDAYPPAEEEHRLTRWLIETLTGAHVKFRIITKGTLILRDLALVAGNPYLTDVSVSVSTHDAELVRRYEPGAPTYEERLATAFALAEAGIPVALGAVPWIPGVTDAARIVADVAGRLRVIFSAIDLGERSEQDRQLIGLRTIASAQRVFGKQFTQAEVNLAFLRTAASFPRSPRVWWLRPPGTVSAENVFRVMTDADLPVLLSAAEAAADASSRTVAHTA
jgi:hypothetical protein